MEELMEADDDVEVVQRRAGGGAAEAGESAEAEAAAKKQEEEDLFGDYDSADEAEAAGAAAPAARAPPRPSAAPAADPGAAAASSSLRGPAGEPPRKARRRDLSGYIEREAEEAGGSGDEEGGDDIGDFIDDTGGGEGKAKGGHARLRRLQEKELEEVRADMDSRGPEMGARRVFGSQFLNKMEEKYLQMEEEEQAAAVEGRAPRVRGAPISPGGASARSGRTAREPTNAYIVPDPQDPKLWCCKTYANEPDLCIALMLKAGDFMARGEKVPIFSVFYSPHLRGYIYIEAYREADIRGFIRGIRGIAAFKINVVPVAEMPLVFQSSVNHADTAELLRVGDWVRFRRGPYGGDLAQIDEVLDTEVVIKLKPRIAYEKRRVGDKESRAAQQRPPQRWFHKGDLEAYGTVNVDRRVTAKGLAYFYIWEGERYRDGFLYKNAKRPQLVTGVQVRPQEHELQDWRLVPPPTENTRPEEDLPRAKREDQFMPPPSFVPRRAVQEVAEFVEGDVVIVNAGELLNMRGVVVRAISKAKTVSVRTHDLDIKTDLELACTLLSKYFDRGDYVKVVGGQHEGDTGWVIKISFNGGPRWNPGTTATVLSASLTSEFEVRVHDLRLTSQKASSLQELGEFSVGQLVRLDGSDSGRGVIVRLEADARAVVVTTTGARRTMPVQELAPISLPQKFRYLTNTWTLDRNGRIIRPNSIIKAPRGMGPAAPVSAEVLYIHHGVCFIKATEGLTGEAAYMAVNGHRCEVVWSRQDDRKLMSKQETDEGKGDHKEDEGTQGKMTYGVTMASKINWLAPWFQKMMGINETDKVAERGAPVRITGGSYKGLRAEVRDVLGDKVLVSLLCKPKLITVSTNSVAPDDYVTNAKRFARRPPADGASGEITPVMPLNIPEDEPRAVPEPPPMPTPAIEAGDEGAAAVAAAAAPPPGAKDEEPPITMASAWDPDFLMEPDAPQTDGASSEAGSATPRRPGAAPGTPLQAASPAPGGATPHEVVLPTRRRRESRIPAAQPPLQLTDGQATGGEGAPSGLATPDGERPSPIGLASPSPMSEADPSAPSRLGLHRLAGNIAFTRPPPKRRKPRIPTPAAEVEDVDLEPPARPARQRDVSLLSDAGDATPKQDEDEVEALALEIARAAGLLGDSPLTVAELTPGRAAAVVVADTPEEALETHTTPTSVEVSTRTTPFPFTMATPMPGAVTPMLPPTKEALTPGGATPGGDTPGAGAETPAPAGAGAETPAGAPAEEPRGGAPESPKEDVPGEATPAGKAEVVEVAADSPGPVKEALPEAAEEESATVRDVS